jgi:hypothetical protein
MVTKATVGSSLASVKHWDTLTLNGEQLDRIADSFRSIGHAIDTQTFALVVAEEIAAQRLADEAASGSLTTNRVKRYDHRCDYQQGDRVFVDNRYGRSFATITKIIRQPPQAFCDKAFLEFDDPEYRTRWEEERSTPYFAIYSGRTNVEPVYVEETTTRPKARNLRLNATATARLCRVLDAALSSDPRFASTPVGWVLAQEMETGSSTRPHISAEPGGVPVQPRSPLPQGCYKAPLLEAIDEKGEATIDDIKRAIQSSLKLGPADWEMDNTGKIVWIHRLHAAIKHLKRVGTIDSPRREVYRRVGLRRETA